MLLDAEWTRVQRKTEDLPVWQNTSQKHTQRERNQLSDETGDRDGRETEEEELV